MPNNKTLLRFAFREERDVRIIPSLATEFVLDIASMFLPLVVGFSGSDHEPVGNTTQKFGMPLRVFRVRHNGMGGHNH